MNWELRPILIAEDSDDDYFLFHRAFQRAGIPNPIHRVRNGEETIRYLSGATPYSDRTAYPFPYLMLLDLKMPLKHGFDVLEWTRQRDETRELLIVVLSSSQQDTDIRKAYAMGANGYVSKSTSVEALVEVVSAIKDFWLKVNCS